MSDLGPIRGWLRRHPLLAWVVGVVATAAAVWRVFSDEPFVPGMGKLLRKALAMPSLWQWLMLGVALMGLILLLSSLTTGVLILKERRLARKKVAEPLADATTSAHLKAIYQTNWDASMNSSYSYIDYYLLNQKHATNDEATALVIELVRQFILPASAASHRDLFTAMNAIEPPVTVGQLEIMRTRLETAIRAYSQLWRYGLKVGQMLFGKGQLPALSEYEKVYANHRGCVKSIAETAAWSQLRSLASWADGLDELLPAPDRLTEFSPPPTPPAAPQSPTPKP
jgi:hypothetical protein